MSNYYWKQPASRIGAPQSLAWTTTSTAVLQSSSWGSQTYQLRLASTVNGYFLIDNTTTLTTNGSNGSWLPANVAPEYITTTPGQSLQFISTSTSSGSVFISEVS